MDMTTLPINNLTKYVQKEMLALQYFRSNLPLIEKARDFLSSYLKMFNVDLSDEDVDTVLDMLYEKVDVVMSDSPFILDNRLIPLAVHNEFVLVCRRSDMFSAVVKLQAN
jgi:hypothetical protein